MKLTGKAKEALEKWLINSKRHTVSHIKTETIAFDNSVLRLNTVPFEVLEDSMKFGVYVDFADSNKTIIEFSLYDRKIRIIDFNHDVEEQVYEYDMTYEFEDSTNLLDDYRTATIEKFNEILNERL